MRVKMIYAPVVFGERKCSKYIDFLIAISVEEYHVAGIPTVGRSVGNPMPSVVGVCVADRPLPHHIFLFGIYVILINVFKKIGPANPTVSRPEVVAVNGIIVPEPVVGIDRLKPCFVNVHKPDSLIDVKSLT